MSGKNIEFIEYYSVQSYFRSHILYKSYCQSLMGCVDSRVYIDFKIPEIPPGAGLGNSTDRTKCLHCYLNKWEGKYFCMTCSSSVTDASRIAVEEELERATPINLIQEGLSIGRMSQMRGITIGFLLAFTKTYNCWKWTSWDVISKIIKPSTQAKRCRYVELEEMKLHVGPAKTFISYAQAGSWGDVVAAILDGGADRSRHVWIDIFAVRQWPSDTPDLDFASTIEHCASFLCVCSYVNSIDSMSASDALSRKSGLIPASDRKKIAFLRVWCLVEIAAATRNKDMPIIMKCGRHVVSFDGSVTFESKDNMLFTLAQFIDIKNAEATVASDKIRIIDDIEKSLTVDRLNDVVKGVLIGAFGISVHQGNYVQCAACGDSGAIQKIYKNTEESLLAAASGGYTTLVNMLISRVSYDCKNLALYCASASNHLRCIEVAINNGANVNHGSGTDGVTPLIAACFAGSINCVELLLANGSDVNAKTSSAGFTPLMAACSGGYVKCAEMLLAKNAHINAISGVESGCWSALICASSFGHKNCVELLIAKGAAVNLKGRNGETALSTALSNGHRHIADILML